MSKLLQNVGKFSRSTLDIRHYFPKRVAWLEKRGLQATTTPAGLPRKYICLLELNFAIVLIARSGAAYCSVLSVQQSFGFSPGLTDMTSCPVVLHGCFRTCRGQFRHFFTPASYYFGISVRPFFSDVSEAKQGHITA